MKFKIFVTLLFVGGAFVSCEDKESEGVSRITYYPVFELKGDEEIFVKSGEAFSDPSVEVTESGTPIEFTTQYTGTYFSGPVNTINTSVADRYTVTYSAINKDGFVGSTSRTVYVAGQGDLVTNLEGLYTATVVRNGVVSAQYTDMAYVIVSKTGNNTYELSDGIGGYYDIGRAYGAGYAALNATFTANNIATNSFTFGEPFGVGAFGGEAKITTMDVNAANKTIHFVTEWDGGPFTFDVTLKQVQF